MIFTVSNENLTCRVDTLGAQLREISIADGTQLLWQGNPEYWSDSAPVLFPYIARLYGGKYMYCGEKYEMGIHGFAANSDFAAEHVGADSVTMVLHEDEHTMSQYPFRFKLAITYAIKGMTLSVLYSVENRDKKSMPFAIGGHPGFNVPFAPDTSFDDYTLTFGEKCLPDRIGFTDELFLSGENLPYPLENGKTLRLSHDLFDNDAIILRNMAKSVTLGSPKSGRSLTVTYPHMPYLGIWHMPRTDAPYVCIEPWTALPSRQGVVEELSCKSDMITIAPGESYKNEWGITVSEE